MKTFIYTCLFLFSTFMVSGQNVVWQLPIDLKDVNLRHPESIILGELYIDIPSDGKVNVRFNGFCTHSVGDVITLGASNIEEWAANDGNVSIYVSDSLHNTNTFSHTRTYNATKGKSRYYAVGQNFTGKNGNGKASIKGHLTVEFIPDSQSSSILANESMAKHPLPLTLKPELVDSVSISTSTKGKVMVVFDGAGYSLSGHTICLTTNSIAEWPDTKENAIMSFLNNLYRARPFINVRVYSVNPGTHTFYAMVKKAVGDTAFSSNAVYASLTAHFVAENDTAIAMENTSIHTRNIIALDSILNIGKVSIDAPDDGKAIVYLAGSAAIDFDDDLAIELADSDSINSISEGLIVRPSNQNDNYTSFSHTRIFNVKKGINSFNAFSKYNNGDNAIGDAAIVGQLIVKFIANNEWTTSLEDRNGFGDGISFYPNPTSGLLLGKSEINQLAPSEISIYDNSGKLISVTQSNDLNQFQMDLSHLPNGIYQVCVRNGDRMVSRKIVKIN